MYLVGIDIGKLKHSFCLLEKETGEILVEPVFFENNRDGFNVLLSSFKHLPQKDILIGMEDTGHYNLALLKFLLDRNYQVALINPVATDLTRKMQGGIYKYCANCSSVILLSLRNAFTLSCIFLSDISFPPAYNTLCTRSITSLSYF